MRAERPAGCLCNPPQKAVARLGSRLLTSGRTTCRFWAALPVRPRQPGHNYAPFFLPQLAARKDGHTMAQLAARGTPRRHPTIWELYLPRVRQRVSLAEPARAKGARRLQISGAVCCIAGPGRTWACGCKTCVRHHGTENRRCGKIAMRRAAKTATPGKRERLANFESKMLSLALPGGYFLIITARRDVSTLDT